MSSTKTVEFLSVGYLFYWAESTETAALLEETTKLAARFPQILRSIEADLDPHGLEKKQQRLEQKRWKESSIPDLPGVQFERPPIEPEALRLAAGRPRMSAPLVLMCMLLRGTFGSVTDREAVERIRDSIAVRAWLDRHGLRMPAVTTVLENCNAVSDTTRQMIHGGILELALEEDLDPFSRVIVDSTAVEANSAWPNESRLLWALPGRAYRRMEQLSAAGLPELLPWHCPRWLQEMKRRDVRIDTAKRQRTRRKLYRQLLDRAAKLLGYLGEKFQQQILPARRRLGLSPRLARVVDLRCEQIRQDLLAACRVWESADQRVLRGETVPAIRRVLSVIDPDAAIICKGGREPVLGYKPQLCRSGNGLVTALRVSPGNRPDAAELVPLVNDSVTHTGCVPHELIADDGYASKLGREVLLAMGVSSVVFTGSKGKRLTPAEPWDSDSWVRSRLDRAAVESLIFVLKFVQEFGQLRRRGIKAVRAEMMEKVISYNLRRIIYLQRLKQEAARKAA